MKLFSGFEGQGESGVKFSLSRREAEIGMNQSPKADDGEEG